MAIQIKPWTFSTLIHSLKHSFYLLIWFVRDFFLLFGHWNETFGVVFAISNESRRNQWLQTKSIKHKAALTHTHTNILILLVAMRHLAEEQRKKSFALEREKKSVPIGIIWQYDHCYIPVASWRMAQCEHLERLQCPMCPIRYFDRPSTSKNPLDQHAL